jgi:predicted RNA-binding protein associated with RNAse of E/G family
VLGFNRPTSGWSAWQLWDAATWQPLAWYVNFERPFVRTQLGFDTRDLCLDLVVSLEGKVIEKDRKDYDERVASGLINRDEATAVDEALADAHRAIGACEQPFDQRWLDWRPDPAWSVPPLPADWARL